MSLSENIKNIRESFTKDLESAQTESAVEAVRVAYLGRNGHITHLMGQLKDLSLEDKKVYGPQLNSLRSGAEQGVRERKELLLAQVYAREQEAHKYFDVTAYKPSYTKGSLHPYTLIVEKIEEIFTTMGYSRAEGPEIEDPEHNFDALNIPADHPARDMHDTFWLQLPGKLLRTHTSTVQIRTLQNARPPLALFAPGRVFRHEATDATHDFVFTQCEGMFIDKHVSLSHLIATLHTFMHALFEHDTAKKLEIRVRPSYFPFVEPGLEVDISCPFCTGGCSVCKKSGFIEIGGAGLVHPHVLQACGLDSKLWQGFAFGLGIERLAMLKFGIHDIRLFKSGSIEFLRQF